MHVLDGNDDGQRHGRQGVMVYEDYERLKKAMNVMSKLFVVCIFRCGIHLQIRTTEETPKNPKPLSLAASAPNAFILPHPVLRM